MLSKELVLNISFIFHLSSDLSEIQFGETENCQITHRGKLSKIHGVKLSKIRRVQLSNFFL